MNTLRVGLVGFGNIGTGLVRHLLEYRDLIAQRVGTAVELVAVADREFERPRGIDLPSSVKKTTDWKEITGDPNIHAVVELVGVGRDGKPTLALDIARATLGSGKHFITANKGLIAPHGGELHALAEKNGALCLYEASVGAGIPIIASMQQSLIGNRFRAIHGIVNGTCNHIITRMKGDAALTMEAAITEAQQLGYAEPDPTFDVGGHDSAYKVVILASLAFGQQFQFEDVRLDGITKLGQPEFQFAAKNGLAMKLLASAEAADDGSVYLSVGPTFVPADHVLAGVSKVFNAVLINAEPIGETLYYGAGAGQPSTASGLVADLAVAARSTFQKIPNPYPLSIPVGSKKVQPRDQVKARFYLRTENAAAITLPHRKVDGAILTEEITVADLDAQLEKLEGSGPVAVVRFLG